MNASRTASASSGTQREDSGCRADLEASWEASSASGPPDATAEAAAGGAAGGAAEGTGWGAAGGVAGLAVGGESDSAGEIWIPEGEADAEAEGAGEDAAGKRHSAKQLCCSITISSPCDPARDPKSSWKLLTL